MKKIYKLSLIVSLYLFFLVLFSDISFAAPNLNGAGSDELEQSSQNISIITSFFSMDLLLNIVFAAITIVGTLAVSKIVEAKLTKYLENTYAGEEQGREELVGVLTRTANISILSIGFAITLTILGIDMGIFLGGLGFGIGFTLKIFLTNFIAGILMVTQGFYHLGDVVEVGGRIGKISKINALFTAVEQFDGVIFYVPNVKFLEEDITNYNSNDKRRIEVVVGVDYNTDIVKAKKIMMQVIDQFPNVLSAPISSVFVEELGESGINLSLRFWISSKDKEGYFITKSNVTETINLAFKQSGIVIPFPQLVLSSRDKFDVGLNK